MVIKTQQRLCERSFGTNVLVLGKTCDSKTRDKTCDSKTRDKTCDSKTRDKTCDSKTRDKTCDSKTRDNFLSADATLMKDVNENIVGQVPN